MSGVINTNGILFIMIILPMFMAQGFVDILKTEREVYTKEIFHYSYYRSLSYVTAKIFVEIPACAINAILYTSIIFYSIGLQGNFWFVVFANFVNMIVCMLIGYTIAAIVPGEIGPGTRWNRPRGRSSSLFHVKYARERLFRAIQNDTRDLDVVLWSFLDSVVLECGHGKWVRWFCWVSWPLHARRTERHVRATKHPTEPRTSVSILVTKSKHRRNRVRAYNRIFYFKSIRVRRT